MKISLLNSMLNSTCNLNAHLTFLPTTFLTEYLWIECITCKKYPCEIPHDDFKSVDFNVKF